MSKTTKLLKLDSLLQEVCISSQSLEPCQSYQVQLQFLSPPQQLGYPVRFKLEKERKEAGTDPYSSDRAPGSLSFPGEQLGTQMGPGTQLH